MDLSRSWPWSSATMAARASFFSSSSESSTVAAEATDAVDDAADAEAKGTGGLRSSLLTPLSPESSRPSRPASPAIATGDSSQQLSAVHCLRARGSKWAGFDRRFGVRRLRSLSAACPKLLGATLKARTWGLTV